MGAEEDRYYSVYEAARVLGVSPARVRQMLRAGELEGKRGEQRIEGVLGPWILPADAVHAVQAQGGGDEDTVAIPAGNLGRGDPGAAEDTPSETSERLSEGVQQLREKAEALISDLDSLEGRLEAAEVEQAAQREALRQAEELSERLRAELNKERARAEPPEGRPAWRRWLGG